MALFELLRAFAHLTSSVSLLPDIGAMVDGLHHDSLSVQGGIWPLPHHLGLILMHAHEKQVHWRLIMQLFAHGNSSDFSPKMESGEML